jgi:hypothetical protein
MPRMKRFSLSINVAVVFTMVAALVLSTPVPGYADGGTFPASPFNGMQIAYSVSGATLTTTNDTGGFTNSRTITGQLGSGTLSVSGSAKMGNGYHADLVVRVWAGDQSKESPKYTIKSGFPGFNSQPFDVAVPIPAGATSGGFSINMTGFYNAGTRGLVVKGDFGGAPAAPQPPSPPPPATVEPVDLPIPEGVPPQGFIEGIEGSGPIYVSPYNESDLQPAERTWIAVGPGQKLPLHTGAMVRTGGGAEVRLRWSTGAVSRIKESSLFEIGARQYDTPTVSEVMGRLWKGMSNFYFPPGAAGAKKFEVSAERANTSIKGTNFDLEETGEMTTLTVIEGTVEFSHNITGEVVEVTAGQTVSALDDGFVWGGDTPPSGAVTPAAGRPGLAGDARPTFADKLSSPASALASITRRGATYPGTRDVNFGGDGLAGFAKDTSYIGYAGSRLNPTQGTILVDYYPYYDLAGAYSEARPLWKAFGQYPPPQQGIILDTVGWTTAHKGAFGLSLYPVAGKLMAQVWDGSAWHNVTWELPAGFAWETGRGYEVGITYGPKGLGLIFDG